MRARAAVICWFLAALAATMLLAAAPASAVGPRAALGDSYASGEGAGGYDPGAGRCHRSRRAWPRLLGVTAGHHLACSGATSVDLLATAQPPDERPQIASLHALGRLAPIDTVFVSVGGNDVRFSAKLTSCVVGAMPCLRDRRGLRAELDAVRPRVLETYRRIATAAAARRVVAVGYPDIAPDSRERDRCLWLSGAERANIAAYARRLDAALAASAREAGIEYVSVRDALDGHELCTRRSWMVPLLRPGRNWLDDPEQAHPDGRGQRAIAALVRRRLGG